MARHAGRTLASLHPEQVNFFLLLWPFGYIKIFIEMDELQTVFLQIYVHVIHLFFQRGEIICCLAELLTEKKDEILSANRRDMELATASGTQTTHS